MKYKKRREIKTRNIIQLVLLLAIILILNFISSIVFTRFDLTAEGRYTIDKTTKALLKEVKDPILIKIYLEDENLPYGFRRLSNSTKELLDEFRVYASTNIQYEFKNPSENPKREQRNRLYKQLMDKGLKPVNLEEKDESGKISKKVIFPGAILTYKGEEIAVNLLKNNPQKLPDENLNNSIQDLEYEFTNAIRKLNTKEYQNIAFIEGHGELNEYEVKDLSNSLAEFYNVERFRMNSKLTNYYQLKKFAVIIIAKPDSSFSEQDKFVIDQYLMNGGKALWLVDFVKASLDSLQTAANMTSLNDPLNLDDILFTYGARINFNLIQDYQCASIPIPGEMLGVQKKYIPAPWFYFPLITNYNNHPITKNINIIKTEFVSTIDTVGENYQVKKTFLLYSSKNTKIVRSPAMISLDIVREQPDARQFNKSNQPIAVLLEGRFESVFKGRHNPQIKRIEEIENMKFKEQSDSTKMIIVSDGDIVKNYYKNYGGRLYPQPLGQDRWYPEIFYEGNKEFILNAINYLCDDEGLMSIRSRELKLRLLNKTKVNDEQLKWQLINILLPIIFVILFGIILGILRKRKYTV